MRNNQLTGGLGPLDSCSELQVSSEKDSKIVNEMVIKIVSKMVSK